MARYLYTVLALVAIAYTTIVVDARSCKTVSGLEGCACEDSDSNEVISLQALVANNTIMPRFQVKAFTNWTFGYEPCGTFDMYLNVTDTNPGYFGCKASTVARFAHTSVRQCEGLGNLGGAKFEYVEDFEHPIVSNLTVTYRNYSSVGKYGAVISLICDMTLTPKESQFEYINKTDKEDTYYLSLRSPCACPGGCVADLPKTTTVEPTTTPMGNATTTPMGNATITPMGNATTTPMGNATTTPSSGFWTAANTNVVSFMVLLALFVFGVICAE